MNIDPTSHNRLELLLQAVSAYVDSCYWGDEDLYCGNKECCMPSAPVLMESISMDDLTFLLDHTDESFSTTLLMLIDRSGKSDAEIYKRAGIDRRLFSKIRSNPDYRPSKSTVLAFAMALELELEDTDLLLERAGYALSHASKQDIVVEYFIKAHFYDIVTLNEILYRLDLPLLGNIKE